MSSVLGNKPPKGSMSEFFLCSYLKLYKIYKKLPSWWIRRVATTRTKWKSSESQDFNHIMGFHLMYGEGLLITELKIWDHCLLDP